MAPDSLHLPGKNTEANLLLGAERCRSIWDAVSTLPMEAQEKFRQVWRREQSKSVAQIVRRAEAGGRRNITEQLNTFFVRSIRLLRHAKEQGSRTREKQVIDTFFGRQ